MEQNNINYDYINYYIRNTISKNTGILKELEKYAYENNVPIIKPEVGKLMSVIGKIVKPNNILEIGTAIGYSSILMSKFLKKDGKIVTIERDERMLDLASSNIKKAGLEDTITIMQGDALEILPFIEGEYDYIFIDGAKGHYIDCLTNCLRLLNTGGVIIADNVLYKGMIACDELVVRRKKTIVKRMREFLKVICNSPQLESSIIPIGDGVAVSYKVQ